jgi:hypothetical protein
MPRRKGRENSPYNFPRFVAIVLRCAPAFGISTRRRCRFGDTSARGGFGGRRSMSSGMGSRFFPVAPSDRGTAIPPFCTLFFLRAGGLMSENPGG